MNKKAFLSIFLSLILLFFGLAIDLAYSSNDQKNASANNWGDHKNQYGVLNIKTFDGEEFDLEVQKGKVVVVNFWASWCSICKEELVSLRQISKSRPEIKIIGVSIDSKRNLKNAKLIADKLNFGNGSTSAIFQTNIKIPNSVPTTLIFDQSGKIRKVINGFFSESDFEEIISSL